MKDERCFDFDETEPECSGVKGEFEPDHGSWASLFYKSEPDGDENGSCITSCHASRVVSICGSASKTMTLQVMKNQVFQAASPSDKVPLPWFYVCIGTWS